MIDWTRYLESVSEKYAQWETFYTLTDAEGKTRPPKTAPLLRDLWVQTIEKEPENRQERPERPEKPERFTVLDGLRKYAANHVLLKGRPGSGKSTALARLLWETSVGAHRVRPETLGKNHQIPILIELRFYETSIFNLILQFLQRHGLNIDSNTLENWLFKNQNFAPLLLLDGINELPSEAARRDLQKFRQQYAKIPMIFTTRDLGIGGDLNIEKKLEMLPLTKSQMRDFVKTYLPEKGEEMLKQLGNRLKELGETTLLLWMLCSVFDNNENKIPANLGLVFRRFTEIYDKGLKADIVPYQESRDWWRELLQVLAWKMTQGESKTEIQVAISRTEAEEELSKFIKNKGFPEYYSKQWLKDLLKYHLIHLEGNDKIAFRHQLIQEYYMAEELQKKLPSLSDEELQWHYLNYLKWTEPVALMLGMVEKKADALRVVKLALGVDFRLGARLAGKVKKDWQQETVALVLGLNLPQLFTVELLGITRSDAAIPRLIQALEDSNVRKNAVEALGKVGSEAAINELIQVFNNFDAAVRRTAIYALAEIGSEAAINELIQALEDSDSAVRRNAAYTLGKIGSEAAIDGLIKALEDSDRDFRSSAASALGQIGSDKATPWLLKALADSHIKVRLQAASALRQIGSDEAIKGLLKALEHSHENVRWSVSSVLGKIGSEVAREGLINALENSNQDIRYHAALALGEIGSEVAIPELIKALKDSDRDFRISAATALGEIGSEVAIPELIKALKDSDRDFRRSAATALGKIGSEELGEIGSKKVIEGLLKALEDSDEYFLNAAEAEALVEIGSDEAIAGLLKALEDSDRVFVRRNAASALGQIGSDKAIKRLLKALEDSDSYVCGDAAFALGKIGSKEAIEGLLKALNDSNQYVRYQAVFALGQIGSDKAIKGLLKALEDSDSYVRRNAASALGQIGSDKAIKGLLKALEDSDSYVRGGAAFALGKIGSEAAIPELLKTLEYSGRDFDRQSAASALGKIGSKEAIEGLLKALEHLHPYVRGDAAFALGKIGSEIAIPKFINLLKNQDYVTLNKGAFYISIKALETIQNKLKYYSPTPESISCPTQSQTSDTPSIIYDLRGATIGNLAHNVQGNQQNYPHQLNNTNPEEK